MVSPLSWFQICSNGAGLSPPNLKMYWGPAIAGLPSLPDQSGRDQSSPVRSSPIRSSPIRSSPVQWGPPSWLLGSRLPPRVLSRPRGEMLHHRSSGPFWGRGSPNGSGSKAAFQETGQSEKPAQATPSWLSASYASPTPKDLSSMTDAKIGRIVRFLVYTPLSSPVLVP